MKRFIYTISLTFNCSCQLIIETFSGRYGSADLTSGTWNAAKQMMTMHWIAPKSLFSETTVLTY